ncbi:MAG: hypothetical protein JST00_38825 [Deltaproteobacteria bacterium]|nr:hypothetical protein [Deltaproteobacteria bacterium]
MSTDAGLGGFSPAIGWSHYRTLMKVEHVAARAFYEIEAERSDRRAQRQEVCEGAGATAQTASLINVSADPVRVDASCEARPAARS